MTKDTQKPAEPLTDPKSTPGAKPPSGAAAEVGTTGQQPRVVSRPEDVAGLVLMQIDLVNVRKDDLTIAIKGLSDFMRQLVRAYGEHTQTIEKLQLQIQKMGRSESVDRPSSNGKRKPSR